MQVPTSAGKAPRVTMLVRNSDDDFAIELLLASLSIEFQTGVAQDDYEVLVIDATSWLEAGARDARGHLVCCIGSPGAASPTLVSTLCAVLDGYDLPIVAIRTLLFKDEVSGSAREWLFRRGRPASSSLIRDANPHLEWLEPEKDPENVAILRESLRRLVGDESGRRIETPADLLFASEGERVQLVGDAFVRPSAQAPSPSALPSESERYDVDPSLSYFGLVVRPEVAAAPRATPFVRRDRPTLSVILIAHDMRREVPRTVASLLPPYQTGIRPDEYEIVVIENGSKSPLDERAITALGPNVSYHYVSDAPRSPARAINIGVERSNGEVLAIMIDGACLVSPGVLEQGLFAWRLFPMPVVATRYFVLGSGLQRDANEKGYDAAEEDRLLDSVAWQRDGYRLFEISSPLTDSGTTEHWLSGWFESNCLLLPRRVFDGFGGCDERFDLPGGGGLIVDVFRQACEFPGVHPVQLIGEGVFHQIHGGITSNTSQEDAAAKKRQYIEQYEAIRGRSAGAPNANFYFCGKLPAASCRWKMRG